MNRSSYKSILLLLSLIAVSACSGHSKERHSGVEVKVIRTTQEKDSLWAYTFSSTNTALRSHEYGTSFILSDTLGVDTVLIHVLYTSEGELIMPILPENSKDKIQINFDKQSVKTGKRSPNKDFATYAQALSFPLATVDSVMMKKFVSLVQENPNSIAAFAYNDLLKDLSDRVLIADTLLGSPSESRYLYIADRLFPLRTDMSYRKDLSITFFADNMLSAFAKDPSKEKKKKISDRWGKHPYFVITAMQSWPTDSLDRANEKSWIALADSLQIPVIALFTNSDTIPKDLLKKRRHKLAYIPIADSIALATRIAEQLYIYEEPYYMLFDSTYLACYQGEEAKIFEQKLREIILKK